MQIACPGLVSRSQQKVPSSLSQGGTGAQGWEKEKDLTKLQVHLLDPPWKGPQAKSTKNLLPPEQQSPTAPGPQNPWQMGLQPTTPEAGSSFLPPRQPSHLPPCGFPQRVQNLSCGPGGERAAPSTPGQTCQDGHKHLSPAPPYKCAGGEARVCALFKDCSIFQARNWPF